MTIDTIGITVEITEITTKMEGVIEIHVTVGLREINETKEIEVIRDVMTIGNL